LLNLLLTFVSQDISCPEAVKLDDIDTAAVTAGFEAAKAALASAEDGSVDAANAAIDMEVNKSMASAVGVSL
jgi:F0F1-type ATP synthase epsilon subunit